MKLQVILNEMEIQTELNYSGNSCVLSCQRPLALEVLQSNYSYVAELIEIYHAMLFGAECALNRIDLVSCHFSGKPHFRVHLKKFPKNSENFSKKWKFVPRAEAERETTQAPKFSM